MIRTLALLAILILTGCTLAQQGAFDLDSYGKKPASLVSHETNDQTAAIQCAIDACYAAGGGEVKLPPGTFCVTGLALHWQSKITVNITGSGQRATFLKKIGTSPDDILALSASTSAVEIYSSVSHLSILGNGKACAGITVTDCGYLRIHDVTVRDCTVGIDFHGSLLSSLADVNALNNNTGMRFRASSHMSANMIQIDRGSCRGNNAWGIDFGCGSGFAVTSVDIEMNGTPGDPLTGGMMLRATCDDETGYATVDLRSCWFEQNSGTSLRTEQALGVALSIQSCNIIASEAGRAIVMGKMRSVSLWSCISGSTNDTWSLNAGQSFVAGGVVYSLVDVSDLKTHLGITSAVGDISNIVRTP